MESCNQLEISKNWNDFEDYTKSLKKKYRSRLKNVMKKSEGIKIKVLTQAELIKHAKKLQELFENVHHKSAFSISPFNTSIYKDLIDSDDPKCQVFAYFLNDEMIAFDFFIALSITWSMFIYSNSANLPHDTILFDLRKFDILFI